MVDNSKRIDDLKKELARDSQSRQFYQLGELLRRDGRLNQAADVLRGGLKHHARYVAAWVALGRTCLDLGHGRESEAADALTQALALDAHNPVAWRLLGEARLACGQRSAALEAMERALALVPGDEVLKAAVEALQAEVEPPPPASMVERRPGVAAGLEPQPQPMPMEPLPSEAPFAFEAAPLELEAVVGPAEVAQEPGQEVGGPPGEPKACEPGQPLPVVAVVEEPTPTVVPPEQAPPTEGPFRDEVVSVETQPGPPTWAESAFEAAPSADVFDVFGEPSAPGVEVTEAAEPVVATPPVEPFSEAREESIQTVAEPQQVADLEHAAFKSPEVQAPEVEAPLPEVAAVEATVAEPVPDLESPPVVVAQPEPEVPGVEPPVVAGECPEVQVEGEVPSLELPVEAVSVTAEPGPPEEEAPPFASVEDLPAEPEVAVEGVEEAERADGEVEPLEVEALPQVPPLAEGGILEEAPGPVAPVGEPPASITLARLYLRQQQMGAAVEVLERLLRGEPDNEEAHDLLLLVRDMMEEAPGQQVPALSVGERKIAALQRWLVRMEQGRERMAP